MGFLVVISSLGDEDCDSISEDLLLWGFDCFISPLPGNSFDSVTANDAPLDGPAAD